MKVNVAALSGLSCEISGPQARRAPLAGNNTGGVRTPNHSIHSTDVTEQATCAL